MSKLTVVYLADTKHVLAALTRADPPAATEPVGALVGAGLPISLPDATSAAITIPAAKLAAVTVDDQPGVPLDPWGFQVTEDPQKIQPPMVAATGVAGSTVTLAISHGAGALVTVSNVPSASLLATVVVLQQVVSPSTTPTILVTQVPANGYRVVAPPGKFIGGEKWNMYAFVQGLRPAFSPALVVS